MLFQASLKDFLVQSFSKLELESQFCTLDKVCLLAIFMLYIAFKYENISYWWTIV